MNEIEKRVEILEDKVKSLCIPGLMNFSRAAEYLGTNLTWLKFLIDNRLIKVTYLPQYKKARIAKVHLDEFIQRLINNDSSDRHLLQVFLRANSIATDRYSDFQGN